MTYLEQRRNEKTFGKPPQPKKIYRIPKKSAKKMQQEKAETQSGSELDAWYVEMRKLMTGRCEICGGKTEKHIDKRYKRSIHHLFPKRKNKFPSVALHPFNRLEVCFYGNSCHTNIENGTLSLEAIKNQYPQAWDTILRRAIPVIDAMDLRERKRVPNIIKENVENFF